jgi:hypothetical protein
MSHIWTHDILFNQQFLINQIFAENINLGMQFVKYFLNF